MFDPKIGSSFPAHQGKTQKGLEDNDIVVIIGEQYLSATFSVSFPECEKFAVTKTYTSQQDCMNKIDADRDSFKANHKSTIFTIAAAENEEEEKEVTNDSMKLILSDWLSGKAKFFG